MEIMAWAIPVLVPIISALAILISPMWNVVKRPGEFDTHYDLRDNRKRFGIFLAVTFVSCALISGGLYALGCAKMYYKEVWNNKVIKIRHEEKWTTHETRTETYTTGSGKNQTTHTRIVHYTETHGPYWKVTLDNGNTKSMSNGSQYNKWKKVWGNEKKVGIHKGSSAGIGRSISGNIYECYWPRTFETIYPYASIHRYKNKVRQAPSVLKLSEPTEELEKRYPNPANNGNVSPAYLYGGNLPGLDMLYLQRINAKLGQRYEIHSLLVSIPMSDMGIVTDILTAWRGPNKNELVTFVHVDKQGIVTLCDVHSWMDNTTLHAIVRDGMVGKPFNTKAYGQLIVDNMKHWRRKEFEDFDYLKVSIHWGWTVGALALAIVASLVAFIVLSNMDRFSRRGYYR